jgi:hypothetical protein
LLTLAFAAPASAGELTSRELPHGCVRDIDGVIAFACDPARRAGPATLTLGSRSAREQLDGAEPLQPGETLTLAWSHPSTRAVLYVSTGTQSLIINLTAGAERVDVGVRSDGSVAVAPGGVVPAPQLPQVTWAPRTPRAAARLVLGAVRHMERSFTAVQALCASLAPGVLDYVSFGNPGDNGLCLEGMFLSIHGDENVPGVVSTRARGLSVAVSGSRAVMRTRLTHRYHPNSTGDPRRLVVTARALLVRDATGVWRLATPYRLFPLPAISQRGVFSDRALLREYRETAVEGRKLTRHHVRVQRQAVARLVPQPCSVPLVGDPTGDVLVETADQARDQAAHAGGDMVAGGFNGRCLTVWTASPLPAAFSVVVDSGHPNIHVANGVVEVYDGDDEDELTPIRGATARLEANALTVFLPRKTTVDDVELNVDVNDVRYRDTVALP